MSFADFLAAAEKGAQSIYHDVLATGAEITSWGSNPLVASLLPVGVAAANSLLTRVVPEATATVVESDIATALKGIAAADPTVPSTGAIGSLAVLAGTVATAIAPAAAPIVGEVEAGVATAESLVEAAAGTPAEPAAAAH